VKIWEMMTKLKGTIDRINLHHRFSEGDERLAIST
jgi:hypothetical protein